VTDYILRWFTRPHTFPYPSECDIAVCNDDNLLKIDDRYLNRVACIVTTDDLALGEDAMQSSTYKTAFASLAVDGDKKTHSCTVMESTEPWWAVDLGWRMDVGYVAVTNEKNPAWGELLSARPEKMHRTIELTGYWSSDCRLFYKSAHIKRPLKCMSACQNITKMHERSV